MKNCLLIISLLFIIACNQNANTPDHSSALPHTAPLGEGQLSEADKLKLAQAKGKRVETINSYDVEQMFDASEERIHIFSFWKMDCGDCKATILNLNTVLKKISTEQFRLVLINLDEQQELGEVNTFIRENNLFAETYHLSPTKKNWEDGLYEDWDGGLPATFFVKEDEDIKVLIPRTLTKEELPGLISSLL